MDGVNTGKALRPPVGCYYEKLANGASACTPCNSDVDCGTNSICSYHYCESL